jgi:hypothetical protein
VIRKKYKMSAILYFHQGFTDIMNCLSLITFYSKQYDSLRVVIRKDFIDVVIFYIKNLHNVLILPIGKDVAIMNIMNVYEYGDVLFIGVYDIFRMDQYNGAFSRNHEGSFVDCFYNLYGVDSRHRIDSFEFERDFDLEESKYHCIVGAMKEYVLYHDTTDVSIEKSINDYIQLDRCSNIFFDCLKILENAKEIHMIDSVWACFVYLVDCKYKLFHDIPIYIYCKRGYFDMFANPPNNWTILS